MSAKGYIISLSLAGTVAALCCWMFQGKEDVAPKPATSTRRTVPQQLLMRRAPQPTASADTTIKSVAVKPAASAATQPAPVSRPLTTEELTARAARVEQEANHDLRRLVELLDLGEVQQDRVFQTLAQHSPSWTPGLQFAPAAGAATSTGKRSGSLAAAPGLSVAPVKAPPSVALAAPETQATAGNDPTDEIMALLDPDQQNTLLEEEINRAAWWAEILEQITPADEVPFLTPAIPSSGAGDVKIYEGSDVLE